MGSLCSYVNIPYSFNNYSSQVIDGRMLADQLLTEIQAGVDTWICEGHRRPHLVAMLVGNDSASHTYVRNKMIAAKKTGFHVF